jgi:nitroreductase
VRAYQSTDIPAKHLEAILSAANQAPSAGNLQAYEIYQTRDQDVKQALTKAAG